MLGGPKLLEYSVDFDQIDQVFVNSKKKNKARNDELYHYCHEVEVRVELVSFWKNAPMFLTKSNLTFCLYVFITSNLEISSSGLRLLR